MQEALANRGADREELLIWVDSADAASVTEALSAAVDRLRQHGFAVPGGAQDPRNARPGPCSGSWPSAPWRWLIVLDNADAGSLIEARPGTTGREPQRAGAADHPEPGPPDRQPRPGGRRAAVHRRGGRGVSAQRCPPRRPQRRPAVAGPSGADQRIGRRRSAITRWRCRSRRRPSVANAMTVPDWIEEFTAAETMDAAADEPDRGGYPHLIGATWQVALGRACQGLPEGVVERAAMVAAIQDPDGHPTWLWDRDAVADWVAGGADPGPPPRDAGGRPAAHRQRHRRTARRHVARRPGGHPPTGRPRRPGSGCPGCTGRPRRDPPASSGCSN